MFKKFQIALFVILSLWTFSSASYEQDADELEMPALECGNQVLSSFNVKKQVHIYPIYLNTGDKITVTGIASGETLLFRFSLLDPVGNVINRSGPSNEAELDNAPKLISSRVSAMGRYDIWAINFRNTFDSSGTVGDYTVIVECNGEETSDQQEECEPTQTNLSFGSPIDLSGVMRFAFPFGERFEAELPETGDGIVGFKFDGNADDLMNMTFGRTSGNQNIGVIIQAETGEVAFITALATLNTLTTQFVLPVSGEYTIGVYAMDLITQPSLEVTGFTLEAVVQAE